MIRGVDKKGVSEVWQGTDRKMMRGLRRSRQKDYERAEEKQTER